MSDNEEDSRCDILKQLKAENKRMEIVKHVISGCEFCCTNVNKTYGGREVLFPDAPPPWIKISEEEKKDSKVVEKFKKVVAPVKKLMMTPEEIDQYLEGLDYGDEKLVYEIRKYKKVEAAEAWKIMHKIRKKRSERLKLKKINEAEDAKKKNEQEGEETIEKAIDDSSSEKKSLVNAKSDVPWSPSLQEFLCKNELSKIEHSEQKRLNAMCQNLMNKGDFQHFSNKKEFKVLMKSIEDEYERLVEAALEWANKQEIFPLDQFSRTMCRIIMSKWNRNVVKDKYFSLSDVVFSIDLNHSAELNVLSIEKAEKPTLIKIIDNGISDTLMKPDMSKKVELNKCRFTGHRNKVPIIDDEVGLMHLSHSNTTSVIMDATTICHLMTPYWESMSYDFHCTLSVKEVQADGKFKKVVIVSKPSPFNRITGATIIRKTAKQKLRKCFVQLNAAVQKNNDETEEVDDDVDDEPEDDQEKVTDDINDPLGSIFAEIDKKSKEERKPVNKGSNGYQYAIFRIGETEVLIRSMPPYEVNVGNTRNIGIIKPKAKVTFEPRIEYLPNGGAMELGNEEWVWNYLKKTFKLSTAHILFRTHYKTDNLLQFDAYTMKEENVQARPPGALSILSSRTLIFEELLKRISSLDIGTYLLFNQENQPTLILPIREERIDDYKSINSLKLSLAHCKKLKDEKDLHYFNGFSPDVVLQWQIVQGRAPRALLAPDAPVHQFLKNTIKPLNNRGGPIRRKRNYKDSSKDISSNKEGGTTGYDKDSNQTKKPNRGFNRRGRARKI